MKKKGGLGDQPLKLLDITNAKYKDAINHMGKGESDIDPKAV